MEDEEYYLEGIEFYLNTPINQRDENWVHSLNAEGIAMTRKIVIEEPDEEFFKNKIVPLLEKTGQALEERAKQLGDKGEIYKQKADDFKDRIRVYKGMYDFRYRNGKLPLPRNPTKEEIESAREIEEARKEMEKAGIGIF